MEKPVGSLDSERPRGEMQVPGPGAYDAHRESSIGEPLKGVKAVVIKKHLSVANKRYNKDGKPVEEERVGPQTYFDPENHYLKD